MKNLLFILLCLPTIGFGQTLIPDAHSEKSYDFLIDNETALKYKDSLVNTGWTYQEKFPFFYKTAKTGRAPKSCAFSPNDSILAVTLLNQKKTAVQFFSTDSLVKQKHYSRSVILKMKTKDMLRVFGEIIMSFGSHE